MAATDPNQRQDKYMATALHLLQFKLSLNSYVVPTGIFLKKLTELAKPLK